MKQMDAMLRRNMCNIVMGSYNITGVSEEYLKSIFFSFYGTSVFAKLHKSFYFTSKFYSHAVVNNLWLALEWYTCTC